MAKVRFCEFTGDNIHEFDEVGYKNTCKNIGFRPLPVELLCLKYNQDIKENEEGWRMCCSECENPIQILDD